VKLPKSEHRDRGYLTHAQVAALAAAVDRHSEAIRFLAYTGLRWGEMAALRVQDFDMLRRRVNVSRSVTECGTLVWGTPKTGERRSVPFPAWLTEELAALMTRSTHHTPRPPAHGGQPGGQRGANVKAVQRMLGHAKASMTLDVYADLFDDDLDVVAGRLDAAIKATAAASTKSAADQLRTESER
jgi:integrase